MNFQVKAVAPGADQVRQAGADTFRPQGPLNPLGRPREAGQSLKCMTIPDFNYSIGGPQGGSTAAPLFILGDFVEAFVGERSPFEEVAM